MVELLLSEHNGDCQTCDRNEDCELKALSAELGIRQIGYDGEKTRKRIDASTPALMRDSGKCIKCRRCVSVCLEMQHVGALSPQNRGFETVDRPGVQPQPGHRGLRAMRAVRRRLPGRRHHREGPDRGGVGRHRHAGQARRRADRPGRPRRAGRVLRLSARHAW